MAEELTGGQIVVDFLIKAGMPYAAGIAGHGCLPLVDAVRLRSEEIQVIQVKQEMCGVHLAEGYFRVCGQPLAVFTSIGPGAVNTAIGVANAFVDSMPVMVFTGDTHTHMFGRGVLQEIERTHSANFPRVLEPIVKRYWQVTRTDQLPAILRRAHNVMMTGRKGPVLIDLPMDVQADSATVDVPEPGRYEPQGRLVGDAKQIEAAAKLLAQAERPVLLAGGGAVAAEAWHEVRHLAEFLGIPVVTTMMGKGIFPEDHELYAWHAGSKGTSCGNKICATADVILAVGCRFADETASSYREGVSFAIPPTKLIHVDIDPTEIGKNYPVEVGIVADAQTALRDLLEVVEQTEKRRYYRDSRHFRDLQRLKNKWFQFLKKHRKDAKVPVMISTALQQIRTFLDRNAIVVTSSGNVQAQVLQEFPFYEPKTHITTGGFSTMGYGLPACIGAKLAAPDRQVVGLVGDGDFMMTMQELSTAVQLDVPIVLMVFNNCGWIAISDLQRQAFGAACAHGTEFQDANGKPYSPDFCAVAKAFGCHAQRVRRKSEIRPALNKAFASKKPAVIEIEVNREFPYTGSPAVGWWDVPIPTYMKERRDRYDAARAEEQLS